MKQKTRVTAAVNTAVGCVLASPLPFSEKQSIINVLRELEELHHWGKETKAKEEQDESHI